VNTGNVCARDRYVAEVIWAWARGDAMLDDAGPSRLMQFLQDSHPLLDWSRVAEEIAEKVLHLGND
jgi:hypothetical protein